MSDGAVVDRYARAVFELGEEEHSLDSLSKQLSGLAQAYRDSSELRSVLSNPLIEQKARDAILAEVASRLGASGFALNTVRLLIWRQRLGVLPEIADRLKVLVDERNGVVRAKITSAKGLSSSFVGRLVAELEQATGHKVLIDQAQDASLIAGVVTSVGDNTIDGTIDGRLAELERLLLQS
jgi:F-type H+-transporting ATPase subunit delta